MRCQNIEFTKNNEFKTLFLPSRVFKVLPPKPGSTPEHGKSGDGESKPDPTKQSWSSTPVQSEAEKPPTPKPAPKPDPKPHVKSEPIFTPIDETVKHKPSPTRLTSYQPLSPKFKPIPPAEPSKPAESVNEQSSVAVKDGIHEQSEETGTDLDNEESHVADEEVTVSVVGGRVVGGKSGGRGRKRKGSTRRTKPPKFASRPAGSATYTPMGDDIYTPMRPKEEKGASLDEDDRPPLLLREPEPSPPTLFPVTNVPSPITIPALKAAPPPPSPPLTKKSPPKQKHLKEATPLSPLTREPHTKPKPPPVSLPKAGKIKSPRRSSPRKSPKQISPPVRKKFKASAVSPKKISPTKLLTPEDREFHPPRTPSPSRISSPSPSPNSPMYSPPLSPAHNSPLHFMIPPTPAFPTRTTSPPPSPPKPLPDLSPDEEDSSSTMPGGLPSMPPPSLPPMPPTSSAKKAMQRTVVAETVGTFVVSFVKLLRYPKTQAVLTKPAFAICEKQRRRSAWTSMQHSLINAFVVRCLDSIIPILAKSKISRLACLCTGAGRFESNLVANLEDRFSRDGAHLILGQNAYKASVFQIEGTLI